ncbi:MAG: hypothetical protein R3281_01415 [Balneolaceae bacterium]|nr:hypothetical protein [Balneolaceae bacterium]
MADITACTGSNGGAAGLSILADLMPYWGVRITGTCSPGNFDDNFETRRNIISYPEKPLNCANNIGNSPMSLILQKKLPLTTATLIQTK